MEYLKLIEMPGGLVAKLFGRKKDRKLEVAGYLSDIADALSQFAGWKSGPLQPTKGGNAATLAPLPRTCIG